MRGTSESRKPRGTLRPPASSPVGSWHRAPPGARAAGGRSPRLEAALSRKEHGTFQPLSPELASLARASHRPSPVGTGGQVSHYQVHSVRPPRPRQAEKSRERTGEGWLKKKGAWASPNPETSGWTSTGASGSLRAVRAEEGVQGRSA